MEYERRDIVAQGDYYTKHVSAMTSEKLHSKSDIAAELAHRDIRISALEKALHTINDINERGDNDWHFYYYVLMDIIHAALDSDHIDICECCICTNKYLNPNDGGKRRE